MVKYPPSCQKPHINYVLNQLVDKGKSECDDRYFLMASLCLSNANFFYAEIKKEIDEKIREMIPPSEEKIEEMSQLGLHLLTFSYHKTFVKFRCILQ